MTDLENTTDNGDEISFKITPAVREDLDRLSALHGGANDDELYSKGLCLLRIITSAYEKGNPVIIEGSWLHNEEIIVPGYTSSKH